MKKAWLNFICIFLCVLIPFIAIASLGFFLPSQFDRTFLGELAPKTERLYSIEEPKIIIIGGSSVSFGIDSALMEEALGMPVVNFGLYATLGTKLMLDLSRGAIKEGDIIIIAPETDKQTYSLYFNAEATWQACDSDFSLITKIGSDNASAMLGGFWKYAVQKTKYCFSGSHLDPEGVYNRASFNEYGDIIYPRPYNIMELGYDTSLEICFSPDIISDDFVGYVNEYVGFAESKGAKVYFSFAPSNEDALDPSTTMEDLEVFTSYIKENFKAELISDPNDYIYRSGYFYDSNFHMNDAGVILHTANLAKDIASALGKELLIDIEIPSPPERPDISGGDEKYDYDENEKYFIFDEVINNGDIIGYSISGVSDLGAYETVLTTPRAYEGKRVYSVNTGAFEGCGLLTDIYITDNINQINNGAFSGAPMLKKVHILAKDPDTTKVNSLGGLCDGMADGAKFYVAKELYGDFVSNYFWGIYADRISTEN
ncbi:MAG: hypothetical protein ACI4QR_05415 [Eubacteriales bacterium]